MRNEIINPIYILKGDNRLRFLIILVLIGFIFLGLFAIQFMGYVMLILVISAILGLLTIRFPFIYLYKDYFTVEKIGITKKYSDKFIYKYKEIREVELVNGHVDWIYLILLSILGKGASGGFSKPDQMILKFKNNDKEIFYRIGRKKEFEKVVNMIQNEINPVANIG